MDYDENEGKKGKSAKNMIFWTRKEEKFMPEALKEPCTSGWRCDNGTFRLGYISYLEKKIVDAFPGTEFKEDPHIDSKLKTWKRHHNTITNMLMTSGFGFNKTDMVIEVETDDLWKNYIKTVKQRGYGASLFRTTTHGVLF